MVKFAAAGYVCVDYYPDFNNRYYITGNGVDVLFNLLDIKKGKDRACEKMRNHFSHALLN